MTLQGTKSAANMTYREQNHDPTRNKFDSLHDPTEIKIMILQGTKLTIYKTLQGTK